MYLLQINIFLLILFFLFAGYSCSQVNMRIGNKRTVLDRIDGTCGGDKTMKMTFVVSNVTAQGKKMVMNGTFHVLEDLFDEPMLTITIIRCRVRENPDTCEHFHSFKTNKCCHLMATKSPLWTPFFDRITPPWRCPLKKGDYIMENAVFDISSFLLFPVQGWFWKVISDLTYTETNQKIFCLYTDTTVSTIGRAH